MLLVVAGILSATGCGAPGPKAPDPADVKLLHTDIDLLGAMARSTQTRTTARVASITACVRRAHRRLEAIAPART